MAKKIKCSVCTSINLIAPISRRVKILLLPSVSPKRAPYSLPAAKQMQICTLQLIMHICNANLCIKTKEVNLNFEKEQLNFVKIPHILAKL